MKLESHPSRAVCPTPPRRQRAPACRGRRWNTALGCGGGDPIVLHTANLHFGWVVENGVAIPPFLRILPIPRPFDHGRCVAVASGSSSAGGTQSSPFGGSPCCHRTTCRAYCQAVPAFFPRPQVDQLVSCSRCSRIHRREMLGWPSALRGVSRIGRSSLPTCSASPSHCLRHR